VTLAVLKEVEIEIATHAAWYETRRASLGEDFLADVDRALAMIAAAPLTWPLWPLPRARRVGARHVTLERFPFSVAYIVTYDVVQVIAVAHMSRKPGYWLRRVRRP
jgi:toxin ParE1/3/4